MYVDDPEWEGPRCRMCCAPVKDPEEIAKAERVARSVDKWVEGSDLEKLPPAYFCSDDCVRAKYIG